MRTRFAVSPLFELVWSTHVLRDARRGAAAPAVGRRRARRLAGLDWAMLDWLANVVRPGRLRARLHHAAARDAARRRRRRARARPRDAARAGRARGRLALRGPRGPGGRAPAARRPGRAGSTGSSRSCAAYWERAIEPWWPAIRAALEADVVHRARRLTAGGTIEVFAGAPPRRCAGATARRGRPPPTSRRSTCAAAGCCSSPTVFAWPRVFAMVDEPWQPALIYTPRGRRVAVGARPRRRPRGARRAARPPPRGDPRDAGRAGGDAGPRRAPAAPRRRACRSTSASCGAPGSCARSATGGACSTRARPTGDALLRRA